jgi:DNA-binding LacI/PurR family transcriptional regulator
MGITIHDVAKLAGVSHTTVSWAIHDDPRLRDATKRRVLAAVAELGYTPNLSARSLVSGRSQSLAIVAASFTTVFELEVMQGLEAELANSDQAGRYSLNQYAAGGGSVRRDRIFRTLLSARRADAVIGLSLKPDEETLAEYRKAGLTLVLVEEDAPGAAVVKTDNVRGARLAVEHLLRRGARRPGLVVGAAGKPEDGLSPVERLAGFRAALEAAGLAFDPADVAFVREYRHADGLGAFAALAGRPIDAVFCAAGDLVATGVIRAAVAAGRRVPDDLPVVAYDDSFIAPLVAPALTTVRQPLQEMGAVALRFALAGLAGPAAAESAAGAAAPPPRRIFDPELVVRDSG